MKIAVISGIIDVRVTPQGSIHRLSFWEMIGQTPKFLTNPIIPISENLENYDEIYQAKLGSLNFILTDRIDLIEGVRHIISRLQNLRTPMGS